MKEETKRISFDVPLEEHTFLKTECAKDQIALRDLMRQVFHNTVQEIKKKKLRERLALGIQEAKENKGRIISQEELDEWDKMIDNA